MIEIKGYVDRKQKATHITSPALEDKHIDFFKKYFDKPNLVINRLGKVTIIHDLYSLAELQLFANAFIYEFGKW